MSYRKAAEYWGLVVATTVPLIGTFLGYFSESYKTKNGPIMSFPYTEERSIEDLSSWLILAIGLSIICAVSQLVNTQVILKGHLKWVLKVGIPIEALVFCPLTIIILNKLFSHRIMFVNTFLWPVLTGTFVLLLTAMISWDSVRGRRA